MESPFSSLVFVVLGFAISLCALIVESQSQSGVIHAVSPPPPPPPPPRPSPPHPQSPTPSPPESPTSPSPNSPSLPDSVNSPPPPGSSNLPTPPKSPGLPPPDRSANQLNSKNDPKRLSPPPHRGPRPTNTHLHPGHKYNAGKKIGLLFVGIAAILQIGVIGFLVFKRRQLLRVKDRYETCS